MRILDVVAAILLVIGGLNWGIYGLFEMNVVEHLFGSMMLDRVIYVLVGVAAVYQAVSYKAIQRRWHCK